MSNYPAGAKYNKDAPYNESTRIEKFTLFAVISKDVYLEMDDRIPDDDVMTYKREASDAHFEELTKKVEELGWSIEEIDVVR